MRHLFSVCWLAVTIAVRLSSAAAARDEHRRTLDESVSETIEPIGGFVQTEPDPGAPATERTEFWLFCFLFEISPTGDQFVVATGRSYELLEAPFAIAPGVKIPTGTHGFQDGSVQMSFGNQRKVSGTVALSGGLAPGYPDLENRAFVLKINRLMRF